MSDEFLEPVAERFRVLGDATRLSIIRLLLERGELNVGEISETVGSSQANVSKHLRTLHTAGIVSRRAEGTAAYYSVSDPTIPQLCDILCEQLKLTVSHLARAFQLT